MILYGVIYMFDKLCSFFSKKNPVAFFAEKVPMLSAATVNSLPAKSFDIAVLNQTTIISDAYIKQILPALQVQIVRDFFPIWGTLATLTFFDKNTPVPATAWQFVFLDDADQADALGYHEITSTGMPLGKVFVKTALQYNTAWSITASHELLEMLCDPYIDTTVFDQTTNTGGALYALEVCDAVEDNTYVISGVKVSDFVYPSWFESFRTSGSTQFSFLSSITSPFALAKGGYISYFVIPNSQGWTQSFGQNAMHKAERIAQKSRLPRRGVTGHKKKVSLI